MVWQMNAEAFLCLIIPALCCFPVDGESWFHKKMRLCYTECGHIKSASHASTLAAENVNRGENSMLKSTILVAVADIKGGVGKRRQPCSSPDASPGAATRHGLDADNTGGATLWDEYVRIEDDRRRKEDEANGTPHKPYKLGFDVIQTNDVILGMPDRIRERYKGWVIIDTPPSDAGTVQTALQAADVSIIPCQPSISDLSHAGKTYAAARNGIILLTRVKARTKLARDAVKQLDELEATRFETVIHEREAIKNLYGTNQIDNRDYASVTQELIDLVKQFGIE